MVKLRESLSEKGQDSYRIKKVVQYRISLQCRRGPLYADQGFPWLNVKQQLYIHRKCKPSINPWAGLIKDSTPR